jgi:sugar phosphate isomerase/epimerase
MKVSDLRLEFGLQSDLFWDPLNEGIVKAAAQSGFNFFEIWAHRPWFDLSSPSLASETKRIVEERGMYIRSVHAPCEEEWDISSEDEGVRKQSVREVILAIENCRKMGGRIVVVHPGRAITSEGDAAVAEYDRRIQKSITSFSEFERAAAENDVQIAVENQWANEVGGKETHFFRLLETLDPATFGICFDSSHANITPGTFEMFQRITHPIITTHLSDNHGTYDEHKPPFTASINWEKVFRLTLKNGFTGPWLLEVTNGGNDPLVVLERMQQSIEKLKFFLPQIAKNL